MDWKEIVRLSVQIFRLYALMVAPVEFAFIERLSGLQVLVIIDVVAAVIILFDVAIETAKEYVVKRELSAVPYTLWGLGAISKLIATIPWIWIVSGMKGFRFILWMRLYYCSRVARNVSDMEQHYNLRGRRVWIAVRIVFIEIFITHAVGCFFYYLATTETDAANTWLGCLKMGNTEYFQFREMGFLKVYLTCFYFASATLTTVGYGDIHPVNLKEMLFAIIVFLGNVGLVGYISGALDLMFNPPNPNPNPNPPPNPVFEWFVCPECNVARRNTAE